MFYKTGYCFTSKDLFDNFNISRLTTKKKFWGKDCKGDSKLDLVAKVLTYCFYLIIWILLIIILHLYYQLYIKKQWYM